MKLMLCVHELGCCHLTGTWVKCAHVKESFALMTHESVWVVSKSINQSVILTSNICKNNWNIFDITKYFTAKIYHI